MFEIALRDFGGLRWVDTDLFEIKPKKAYLERQLNEKKAVLKAHETRVKQLVDEIATLENQIKDTS